MYVVMCFFYEQVSGSLNQLTTCTSPATAGPSCLSAFLSPPFRLRRPSPTPPDRSLPFCLSVVASLPSSSPLSHSSRWLAPCCCLEVSRFFVLAALLARASRPPGCGGGKLLRARVEIGGEQKLCRWLSPVLLSRDVCVLRALA